MSIGMVGGIVAMICWFALAWGKENERKALKKQGKLGSRDDGHDFSTDAMSLNESIICIKAGWTALKCTKCGCYKIMKGIMPSDTVYKKHFQQRNLKKPPPCI